MKFFQVPETPSSIANHSPTSVISACRLSEQKEVVAGRLWRAKYRGLEVMVERIGENVANDGLEDHVRELSILARLPKHKNVATVLDLNRDIHSLRLISMWCSSFTLRDYLDRSPNSLTPAVIKNTIMPDLLSGLSFLHTVWVIHGDIRPENVRVVTESESAIVVPASTRWQSFSCKWKSFGTFLPPIVGVKLVVTAAVRDHTVRPYFPSNVTLSASPESHCAYISPQLLAEVANGCRLAREARLAQEPVLFGSVFRRRLFNLLIANDAYALAVVLYECLHRQQPKVASDLSGLTAGRPGRPETAAWVSLGDQQTVSVCIRLLSCFRPADEVWAVRAQIDEAWHRQTLENAPAEHWEFINILYTRNPASLMALHWINSRIPAMDGAFSHANLFHFYLHREQPESIDDALESPSNQALSFCCVFEGTFKYDHNRASVAQGEGGLSKALSRKRN